MNDLRDIKAGVYQHYKGEHYNVLGVAHDANADHVKPMMHRLVVVYVPLYMADGPRMAVRTYDDFFAEVETDLGKVPRFRYIGP